MYCRQKYTIFIRYYFTKSYKVMKILYNKNYSKAIIQRMKWYLCWYCYYEYQLSMYVIWYLNILDVVATWQKLKYRNTIIENDITNIHIQQIAQFYASEWVYWCCFCVREILEKNTITILSNCCNGWIQNELITVK